LQLVWPTAIQIKMLWRLETIMWLHDAGHMNKDKINIRCKTIKMVHRISEIYRIMYCFIHKKPLHAPAKRNFLKRKTFIGNTKIGFNCGTSFLFHSQAILNISIRNVCHLGKQIHRHFSTKAKFIQHKS
jgi:hypothetical protein